MDIISSAVKLEKDIEIYMNIRDLMHELIKESMKLTEEVDLKELKLKLDIADKSIQNRLRLLVQIGKLDIDLDKTNNTIEELTEKIND